MIHKSGNSFGENRRKRGRWTRELDFEVKDARKEPVDVLWFVGDYASFDPRSQTVTRARSRRLYRAAGSTSGSSTTASATPATTSGGSGEEGLFESLAEQNIAALEAAEFNRIVTTDPHSLNTLRNEYPELGGSWPVSHHTELLLELIESGRLELADTLGLRGHLPRPLLSGPPQRRATTRRAPDPRALGCTLVEMPRNRDNTLLLRRRRRPDLDADDAGGRAPVREPHPRGGSSSASVDYFVVACPKDVTMYEDAIKTSGNAERIELREVTELVLEAMGTPQQPDEEAAAVT